MTLSPQGQGAQAPVYPISAAYRTGGLRWRREHGLLTLRDLVNEYNRRRFIRPGALFPLPEDLLPHGPGRGVRA